MPRTAAVPGSVGLRGGDASIAALLAGGLAVLYLATLQERQYGDGAALTRLYLDTLGTGGVWSHVLYLPVARALLVLLAPANPVAALHWVSPLGAACGGGLVFLLARACGAQRVGALAATLLFALAPAAWFFATAIEVYGLHVACVALAALVTVLAPWQRPALAVACAGLALPLVFASHQSGLFLGPGFVALAQVGRERRGLAPLSWPALLLGVGPAFLASFLVAIAVAAHLRDVGLGGYVAFNAGFVAQFHDGEVDFVFAELWGRPLGALGPAALAALIVLRMRGWLAWTLVAWCLPPVVFFGVWGLVEHGGYTLSAGVLLAAAAALGLGARTGAACAGLAALIALQAALGWVDLKAWDAPPWASDNRARAAVLQRVLGPRGSVYSLNLRFQDVEPYVPGLRETNLYPPLRTAADGGLAPEAFVEDVVARVRAARRHGPVALEFSAASLLEGRPEARFVAALRQRLEREFPLRAESDPRWPLSVIPAAPDPQSHPR